MSTDTKHEAPHRSAEKRQEILRSAVALASVEGLNGLSIGKLADAVGMTKSGLFAHFGSKESLDLATIEEAKEIYRREVFEPSLAHADGVGRLDALLERWIAFLDGRPFPGGCFFAAAFEQTKAVPGPIHDQLAEIDAGWTGLIVSCCEAAIRKGEMDEGADPVQFAFEARALINEADRRSVLHGEERAFDFARAGIRRNLQEVLTAEGVRAWVAASLVS